MIKIIYPDGKIEYQDVRRLTNYDLYLVFGNWATMRYVYTTYDTAGRPVDFYIVYEMPATGAKSDKLLNRIVLEQYGLRVYGTAIICRSDILDTEE